MRKRFIIEVDVIEHNAVLSNSPPSLEAVADTILHHIKDSSGYYPLFNYNTVTVRAARK